MNSMSVCFVPFKIYNNSHSGSLLQMRERNVWAIMSMCVCVCAPCWLLKIWRLLWNNANRSCN